QSRHESYLTYEHSFSYCLFHYNFKNPSLKAWTSPSILYAIRKTKLMIQEQQNKTHTISRNQLPPHNSPYKSLIQPVYFVRSFFHYESSTTRMPACESLHIHPSHRLR